MVCSTFRRVVLCYFAVALPVLVCPGAAKSQVHPQSSNVIATSFGQQRPERMTLKGNIAMHIGPKVENGTVKMIVASKGERRFLVSLESGDQFGEEAWGFDSRFHCRTTARTVVSEKETPNCWLAVPWFFPTFGLASDPEVQLNDGADVPSGALRVHRATSLHFKQASGADAIGKSSVADLHIDPGTGLPASLTYKVQSESGRNVSLDVKVMYGDYHVHEGVQVPHSIKRYINNNLQSEIQVEQVEF